MYVLRNSRITPDSWCENSLDLNHMCTYHLVHRSALTLFPGQPDTTKIVEAHAAGGQGAQANTRAPAPGMAIAVLASGLGCWI